MTNTSQTDIYASPAYKRSRRAYTLECAFEYYVALLVSGAFLSKLLTHIGVSDALNGVISSFISLAFFFQLFSILVVQRITNTKRFVILIHTLGQLCFMSLYLIPFIPAAKEWKEFLFVLCILAAYFGNYFVTSILFKWCNSHVDPYHRAQFSGTKEMISLISGVVVSLGAGKIIDAYEAANNLEGGFLFIAVAIFIFCLCDFICLLLVQGEKKDPTKKAEKVPMREVMHATLGNANFRHVILAYTLWNVAIYMTIGFFNTYLLNAHELAFSVGTVSIFNLIGNLGRFALTPVFAKFSDRTSYVRGFRTGLIVAAAAFTCCACITPATRLLAPVYIVLYAVCQAGISQNMFNITYSYVDERYFVQASALKNSIGGSCGFIASLLASRLFAHIQENGNRFLGIPIYGQQVLAIITLSILIFTIIYTKLVLEKQKTMRQ